MFCLPKKIVKEIGKRLASSEMTVEKLSQMSPEQRRAYFAEFMGKDMATQFNAMVESKLLLKDQQAGLVNGIEKMAGLKPEVKRDFLSRVQRLDKLLTDKELNLFSEDLIEQKLGMRVTMDEFAKITELSREIEIRKQNLTETNRLEYGAAQVLFSNYVNAIKLASEKKTFIESIKDPRKFIEDVAGTAKSLKSSMDNSAVFRQGWKVLFTHPKIWLKNAVQTFSDISKSLRGRGGEVKDAMNADILSRENAVNGIYKKAKTDVGKIEEAYPTMWAEKVPILGRLYKASEVAFTAFVQRVRADVMDKYIEVAKENGIDISDTVQLESIGKLVNSLTGRGHLGRLEPAAGVVNNVFFSPRLLKSNIDFLTAHQFQKGVTPFVRKQAAKNLLKVVAGTAAVLTIAEALQPGSVETDPRSSDFGKIRIGDTRFDVSGGMSSIVTLASRLATMSSKSSATGKITQLNSGEYGSQTGADVIYNFFENKFSPAMAVIKDLMRGQDFSGNKLTVSGELSNLFVPMIVTNYTELKNNPNSANMLLSMMADAFGIGINTYSASQTNWAKNPGLELQQFQKKVGDTKFKEANDLYNKRFNDWYKTVTDNYVYISLPEEDKQRVFANKKEEIKQNVLKEYGFKYKSQTKKLPKL